MGLLLRPALAVLLTVSAGNAWSKEAAPVRVSELLGDAGRLTGWLVERDPELAAASARFDQARAELAQAGVYPNPVLDLSIADITVGATNPTGLGFGDTSIYSIGASQ